MAWSNEKAEAWARARGWQGTQSGAGEIINWAKDNNLTEELGAQINYHNENPDSAPPGIRPMDVADMNDYQKDALYQMGNPITLDPRVSAALDEARAALGDAGAQYDVDSYEQFMNPFIEQVISRNADAIRRNSDVSRLNAREELAANGGFGSSALATYYAQIDEAQDRQIGDMDAALRAQGFDSATGRAMDLFKTNRANDLARVSQGLNLSGAYQNFDDYARGTTYMGQDRKLFAGDRIQGQNQAVLDSYFNEFNNKNAFPYQQTDYLKGVVTSYPTGSTQTASDSGNPYMGAVGGAIVGNKIAGNPIGNYVNYSTGGFKGSYNPSNTYGGSGPLPWL